MKFTSYEFSFVQNLKIILIVLKLKCPSDFPHPFRIGLNRLCSATFEQLLAFGKTFF